MVLDLEVETTHREIAKSFRQNVTTAQHLQPHEVNLLVRLDVRRSDVIHSEDETVVDPASSRQGDVAAQNSTNRKHERRQNKKSNQVQSQSQRVRTKPQCQNVPRTDAPCSKAGRSNVAGAS